MIKVYMIDPEKQREAYNPIRKTMAESAKLNLKYYKHVADLDTNSLDEAYDITQNYVVPWQENSYVTLHAHRIEFTRSTMVGDIFEMGGTKYVVDRYGFTKLDVK